MKAFLFLFLFSSCGIQVYKLTDTPSGIFNSGTFAIDANPSSEIKKSPDLYEYEWTFDFLESNGTHITGCITPYTLGNGTISYLGTIPAGCSNYPISGSGSTPAITPNASVSFPVKANFCLNIRNVKTKEVVSSGKCGSATSTSGTSTIDCSGKFDASDTKYDVCKWAP